MGSSDLHGLDLAKSGSSAATSTVPEVRVLYSKLVAIPIVDEVLNRLQHELPPDLYYHSFAHTLEVVEEVLLLATLEGVPERETLLLGLAAAFHDAGFLVSRSNNEGLGADMAVSAMRRDSSFTPAEIQLVRTWIMDTAMVQTPQGFRQIASHPLSGYLLDADLSNIGREDFLEKAERHCREVKLPDEQFFENAIKLLKAHTWHTRAARKLRQARKLENLALLEELYGRE